VIKNNKITILLVLIMLVACGEPPATDGKEPLKIYRHAMDGSPGSLDPAQAASIYANFLVVNLYDTLYRYKYLARPYELQPNLATGMPEVSEDGLHLTIRIKQDVHFIDDPVFADGIGREVRAEDFVYSIKRHFNPETRAQGAWLWQNRIQGLDAWKADGSDYDAEVEGLRASDDYTVEVILTQPYPQFVHTLTGGFSAIVAREAVEEYGQAMSNHAVGSGPFRLQSRDSVRALLSKNPGFRREPFDLQDEGYDPAAQGDAGLEILQGRSPPFVDQIEFEFIKDGAARWNTFAAGEIHYIRVPALQFDVVLEQRNPLKLYPQFEEEYNFATSSDGGFIYTNFNMSDDRIGYHADPVQNSKNHALRCAMVKSFDWVKRNQVFFYDVGQVFPGILPPYVPEYDPQQDFSSNRRDLTGARELLLAAGWDKDSLPVLDYGFPSSVSERQVFEQFRSFMMDIDYPSEKIQPMIFATYGDYQRAYSQGKVTLINSSWIMDYPDTENLMQLYYGPNAAPGSNTANYNNPEYNRLYDVAATMVESPERTKIYRKMNELLIADCISFTGISRTLLFMWDKKVIMKPDRSFLGGYFMRFVDLADPAHSTAHAD